MVKTIIKGLLMASVMFFPTEAYSDDFDFESDGIQYDIMSMIDRTCSVVGYTGDSEVLDVPGVVVYDSNGTEVEFTVKEISRSIDNNDNIKTLVIPATVDLVTYYGESVTSLYIEDSDNTLKFGWMTSGGGWHINGSFGECNITTIYLGRNIDSYFDFYASNQHPTNFTVENLTIGPKVTRIEDYMFYYAKLTSVTLPENISEIGKYAFSDVGMVNSLSSVPPTIDPASFSTETYLNATLNVPIGSKEAYLNSNWKAFVNIREVFPASSVNAVEVNEASVKVVDGRIVVSGAGGDSDVEVYNQAGQLVYRGTESTVGNLAKGIYIVRVAGQSFKVAL